MSQVTRWLAPAIARTRGAANTHVVADVTALREATGDPSIPDDVEGVYYAGGRDIYLVASHLPDRETALRKFAHEMFGHLAPEHYGDIDRAVRMVRNLRRMGSKSIGALWDEVAQRDSSLDPVDHAKEVIALMAERGVKNDMMERLLAWARSTLREWGITLDFTEAELRALIARAARALQRDAAEGASSSMDAASPSPSRGPKLHSRADNLAFVSEVMRQLGAVDDLFKNPPSAPTSLIDVFADIPGYLPPETDTDPDAEPGVQRNVTHFTRRIEGGGTDRVPVHIYQRGRDVWIDVSRLRRGEGGDRIYQGIADYARATGRRFIGDPAGLSPDASARRTYHMLSNLLRYGDLKGFEPAREQLEGNAKAGIPPLAWPADNEGRLRSLIKTFYGTLRADFPEITNYGYDFETGQYTDRRGKRLPEDALKHLLAVRGRAVPYRRRAVRAGIFLQSLARLESEARSGVLAEVLRQPERVVQRSKALFSRDGVASTSPLFSRPASTAGQTINSPWQADNDFLREKHKGAWLRARKAFVRWFAPQGLLPDSVFAAKITRDNEFQAVEFDVRHLVGDLEHAIKADFQKKPNQLSEAEQRDLSDALAGRPGPRVPLRTLTAILAMRQYIDTLSGEYAEILGRKIDEKLAGDPDADVERDTRLRDTILGNIGQYVHRSYRAFDDPKWFEKVPDATLNAARTFLQASYVDQGLDAATAKRRAEVALHEILKNGTAYDSFEHFAIESKLGGKDLSVLMQRQQVPPELRALLGEYVDPTINFAKSALKMGRLIWNERFLTRVRALGLGSFLFEGEERPPDATAQLAAEGSEAYAPLNGLWTTPEIAQAFKDALGRENVGDFYRTVIRLNGAVKYSKTVLSPTTAARNFQSAMFFSLANGHFDVRQMRKSLTALREQVLNRPSDEDLTYLRRLKQLGVIYDTAFAGEMKLWLEDARLDELLTGERVPVDMVRKLNEFARGFYTFGDDFWKILGFENEKAGLIRAGVPVEQAETEAAERIRNTYPTYSMVGKGIRWLSRFPLAGTFVSFPAEIIRTSGNMIRYAHADLTSPDARRRALGARRLVGLVFVSAGFFALSALSRAMLGVDDDEDEAVRDLAAPWQKNSMFLYAGRTKDGDLRYFDLSFLDPYGYLKRPLTALARGESWDRALAGALKETLEPFLGADISAEAIYRVIANRKTSGGRVYNPTESPWRQARDIADYLREALQPGFIGNAQRLVKAAQEIRREGTGQPYRMSDELMALVGWRATTLDPKVALYYRSGDFVRETQLARTTLTQVLTSTNEVDDGEIRSAYRTANEQYEQAFKDMSRLIIAAERAGLRRQDTSDILELSSISQANILALLNGRPPPLTVSEQSMDRAKQKAQALENGLTESELDRRWRIAAQEEFKVRQQLWREREARRLRESG